MRGKNGKVYFIGCNYMGIKIGYTKNDPSKRLKQLQTGCPYKLELLYVMNGCNRDTEQYYHRFFTEYLNINGEWYDFQYVSNWLDRYKLTQKVLRKEGII